MVSEISTTLGPHLGVSILYDPEAGEAMKKSSERVLVKNKKAYRDYDVLDTYEAGLVLRGTEVKSLRQGRVSLSDSYAHVRRGEIFLRNVHISPYDHSVHTNHEPLRERKVLLHKQEIKRLIGKITERGMTLIPLKIYFNEKGLAKVMLGLVKGKKKYDRSKEIKERDMKRDMEREFKKRYN